MCVFGKVLLSAFWRVLCEYWICVFDKVSLSVLWRIFDEYLLDVCIF